MRRAASSRGARHAIAPDTMEPLDLPAPPRFAIVHSLAGPIWVNLPGPHAPAAIEELPMKPLSVAGAMIGPMVGALLKNTSTASMLYVFGL
jgi:hypothetical protein